LHSATKKDLLIAESDLAELASLEDLFLALGYGVRTATSGFQALAEINASVPEVLLCDLNLPGMSGFDLLAVVSRRFPDVRLIAMSGAFSGPGVTCGVAAHWVHQRGTGTAALLSAVASPGL
jgi:CheY-like chemotaxis protein